MVGAPWPGHGTDEDSAGVQPLWAALLFVVLGFTVLVPSLEQPGPQSLAASVAGRADAAHNLRILQTLLRIEAVGLWLLALLAWRNPRWLRALGGDVCLERFAVPSLAVLAVVHLGGVLFYLPPQQILSADPLYTADHSVHLYRAFGARQVLPNGGPTGGYDPFVNAGTPWTPFPDSRGLEGFARLLPFVGLTALGKLWVLLVEAAMPLCVWAASRLGGLDRRATWLALLLALVYWHGGRPFLGHYRWNGNHSFLLAALLALVCCGLAIRIARADARERWQLLLPLWGLLVLLGFVHPLGLVLPALPLILLAVWSAPAMGRIERVIVTLVPVSLLLVHAHWWAPLLQQRTSLPWPAASLQLRGVQDLLQVATQTTVWPILLIGLLAVASVVWEHARRSRFLLGFGGLALVCLALAAWGYATPGVRRFDTARFLVPCVLALCVMAGGALAKVCEVLRPRLGATMLLLLLAAAATTPVFAALLDTRFTYVHRVQARLDSRFHDLMFVLQQDPRRDARLLFESTRRGWLTPDGGDAALEALVPVFTHRQVVGIGHPGLARRDRDLAFGPGQLAGRPFAVWTQEEFALFLQRYEIGTVVAWSTASQLFLSRFPQLLESPRAVGTILVFGVRDWQSSLDGKADIAATYDRIELRRIRSDDIVLPYHWQADLRSTPEVPLQPVQLPGTVAPFVRVVPRGNDVVILHP